MICTRGVSATAGARALAVAVVTGLVVTGSGLLGGPVQAAESSPSPTPGQTPAAEGEEDASEGEAATPLTVSLTSLTPGVVPQNGSVVLEGTVRNDSDEVWSDVNAAVFLGEGAMTTREEIAQATATDEATDVGSRLDLPGSFVALGDLAPGAEVAYSVQVPQQALPAPDSPGVYWIGVHALGSNSEGRDSVADGRARTVIPVVSAAAASRRVPVSLVLPLREPAPRAGDGSLAAPRRWVGRTSARLERLADFAASSGSRSLTWLIDPAVLDALDDLGQGNPPMSLGPPERAVATDTPPDDSSDSEEPDRSASTSPTPSQPSPSASPPATDAEPEIEENGLPDPGQAAAARELLDRLVQQAGSGELLALPYADADAVALARERPELLVRAMGASQQSLATRALEGEAAIAPPDGLVDLAVVSEVLPRLPEGTRVVMSDQGGLQLPPTARLQLDGDGQVSEGEGVRAANPLVLSDARASAGGPSPVAATDPLALRQRVLAEAAVEVEQAAAEGLGVRPVVVTLPDDYDPGPDWSEADFFPELDTPWVDLAVLPPGTAFFEPQQQAAPDETPEDPAALPAYPHEARAAELPLANAVAADELVEQAETLDGLLANNNDVLSRLTGAALQATSYAARERPGASAGGTRTVSQVATTVLDDVAVFGTEFVTLSGGSGTLTVTLVNDLEQPVTLGVEIRAREDVRVESQEPVELGPEQRATLRLQVVSEEGVHDVDLQAVTSAGDAVGEPFGFVLRTSQVGRLVWFVMAGGAVVFAVTLLRRVRQRLRERREPEQDAADDPARVTLL